MTAKITKDCTTAGNCYEKWQLVFLIAASIHSFDIVFYLIFANGELQDWASQEEKEQILGEHNGNSKVEIEDDNNGAPLPARYGTCDTK